MRAADTNVVLRLIARDDNRQVALAEAFVQGGAWVSMIALAEALWVLSSFYRRSSSEIAAIVEMLLEHKDLVLQEADIVGSALKLFRSKPALGFSDCLIVELARKAGHHPLGTFDRDLARVEGVQKL
jgi:predicted nucleic-acid-binding protein